MKILSTVTVQLAVDAVVQELYDGSIAIESAMVHSPGDWNCLSVITLPSAVRKAVYEAVVADSKAFFEDRRVQEKSEPFSRPLLSELMREAEGKN